MNFITKKNIMKNEIISGNSIEIEWNEIELEIFLTNEDKKYKCFMLDKKEILLYIKDNNTIKYGEYIHNETFIKLFCVLLMAYDRLDDDMILLPINNIDDSLEVSLDIASVKMDSLSSLEDIYMDILTEYFYYIEKLPDTTIVRNGGQIFLLLPKKSFKNISNNDLKKEPEKVSNDILKFINNIKNL